MSLPLLATKRHQSSSFQQATTHLGPQITSNFGLARAAPDPVGDIDALAAEMASMVADERLTGFAVADEQPTR
jgi:hypothetical protein